MLHTLTSSTYNKVVMRRGRRRGWELDDTRGSGEVEGGGRCKRGVEEGTSGRGVGPGCGCSYAFGGAGT